MRFFTPPALFRNSPGSACTDPRALPASRWLFRASGAWLSEALRRVCPRQFTLIGLVFMVASTARCPGHLVVLPDDASILKTNSLSSPLEPLLQRLTAAFRISHFVRARTPAAERVEYASFPIGESPERVPVMVPKESGPPVLARLLPGFSTGSILRLSTALVRKPRRRIAIFLPKNCP